jgi:hypothetical protein
VRKVDKIKRHDYSLGQLPLGPFLEPQLMFFSVNDWYRILSHSSMVEVGKSPKLCIHHCIDVV